MRRGDLFRTEIPHPGNVRYLITNLYPNTYHLIEIRAHNTFGFSQQSRLVIKTARGKSERNLEFEKLDYFNTRWRFMFQVN